MRQLHSSEYTNPGALPAGPTLVVGAANSGLQIAAELAQTRQVTVAAGTTPPAVAQRIAGKDLFGGSPVSGPWTSRPTRCWHAGCAVAVTWLWVAAAATWNGAASGSRRAWTVRRPVRAAPGRCARQHRPLRRRLSRRNMLGRVGHRLPTRLHLDRRARHRPGRNPPTRPGTQHRARLVVPRPTLAAHPRIRAARLRRPRRRARCHPAAQHTADHGRTASGRPADSSSRRPLARPRRFGPPPGTLRPAARRTS